MKSLFALVIVAITGFLGFRFGAVPLFDAAATQACASYATEYGLVVDSADGYLSRRTWFSGREGGGRRWSSAYSCRFRDASGAVSFLDEVDDPTEPTWKYRGLRLAGWAVATISLVVGVGVASVGGMLEPD